MHKKIKVGLLRRNPFNPKHDFKTQEKAALNASLKKHGVLGAFVVFNYDWVEQGTFVVLEGNTRFSLFGKEKKVDCIIYDFLNSDEELEKLTIEYTAVGKKLNKTQQLSGIEKYKDIAEEIKQVFKELKIHDIEDIKRDAAKKFTRKSIVCTFDCEESFLKYKKLVKKLTCVIKYKSEILKELEKRGKDPDKYIDSYVEKKGFDILLNM